MIENARRAVIPEALADGTLVEMLEAGVLRYFDHLRADPEHEQAMLELTQYAIRSPERHPLARAQYARYVELAEQSLVIAAERTGMQWRVPLHRVARVLVAFTDGLTLTWLVDRDDEASMAVAHASAVALSRMAEPR